MDTPDLEHPAGIAIKDNKGDWVRRFVDKETYTYILQLEHAIKYPELSDNIKRLYPERFK